MLFYASLLLALCLIAEWRAWRARRLARRRQRSAGELADLEGEHEDSGWP
jgi:hypothetical protein